MQLSANLLNKKYIELYLSGGAFTIAGGIFIWSLKSQELMSQIFVKASFYIILALCFVWVTTLLGWLKESGFVLRSFLRENYIGILICLSLTCLVFVSVPPEFRTLSDETNLLSVSKSMLADRTVNNSVMGKYYFGNYHSIVSVVDKRPLLFPFFTFLIHLVRGFNPNNPFLVNSIGLFFLLLIFYLLIRDLIHISIAWCAPFLLCAQPIITLSATSAGFDLMATTFFFITMRFLYLFLAKPSTNHFVLLWINFLMLSNTRYESIAVGIPIMIGLIASGYMKKDIFLTFGKVLGLSTLLLLPLIWQFILCKYGHENPPEVPLFSLLHAKENLLDLVKSQLDFGLSYPYANVLTPFALVSIFCLALYRRFFPIETRPFLLLFFVCLFVNFAIVVFHYNSLATMPHSARHFLLIFSGIAICPLFLIKKFPGWIPGRTCLVFSIVIFLLYHPIAIENSFMNSLILNRDTKFCMDFLNSLKRRNLLVISDRPGQYTSLNFGAVDFSYANQNTDSLLSDLRRNLYSSIFVFQLIRYDSRSPADPYHLNKAFHLNPLHEIQSTGSEFLRVSSVTLR